MRLRIIFSVLFALLFAAVSFGQEQPTRLFATHIPDSNGGYTSYVTFTGLEKPNLQIFESLVPASSAAECEASTEFPNPRVLGPDVASVVFDPSTGTYKLRWLTPKPRTNTCRVLRVGQSIDATDLAMWQSNYGVGALAENSITEQGSRRNVGDTITFTITLTNAGPGEL